MTLPQMQRVVVAVYLGGLLVGLAGFSVGLAVSTCWGSGLLGAGGVMMIGARVVGRRRRLAAP